MEESNITIAQKIELEPIADIAKKIGLEEKDLFLYGPNMAKVSAGLLKRFEDKEDGKLILVTAITPTKAGEGESTTVVG